MPRLETFQLNGDNTVQRPIWKESPIYIGATKYEPLLETKNIMITGGAGFIASWLARHLTLTYPHHYQIICFDKKDYCASLNNVGCIWDRANFQFEYGDVTDIKAVMRCIKAFNVDTIFHFAAQSHVDLSFGNSFDFTDTNVKGTHVMLESAVKLGIKRFIHVSTDEVNGEVGHDDADLLEDSILAPTNPYAASKAAAEMYVHAYAKSFKLPFIIVRSNNVYGPHQYPEKIIPKFACLLDRQQPLVLHGDGTNKRKYLFAGDSVDAFDTILHKGTIGEIYNVGSRDEISNIDLSLKLLDEFDIPRDPSSKWVQYVKDRPFNDKRYAVDVTKLRSLGWEQKTTFEAGLRLTVGWYRQFGRSWWGDIDGVLATAFPVIELGPVFDHKSNSYPRTPIAEPYPQPANGKHAPSYAGLDGALREPYVNMNAPVSNSAGGNPKKRSYESGGKENEDFEAKKRVMLRDGLSDDNADAVR